MGTALRRRSACGGADNVIEKRFNAVEKIRPRAPPKREASVCEPTAEKFFSATV
jgi:hypothetical protein